jgi:hypothetical protein
LKAFAQACFQGGLQFFVHGLAHLIELGGIGFLQLLQLLVQGVAHLAHAPRIALAQRLQLGVQSALHQRQLLGEGLLQLRHAVRQLLAVGARRLADGVAQLTLQAF